MQNSQNLSLCSWFKPNSLCVNLLIYLQVLSFKINHIASGSYQLIWFWRYSSLMLMMFLCTDLLFGDSFMKIFSYMVEFMIKNLWICFDCCLAAYVRIGIDMVLLLRWILIVLSICSWLTWEFICFNLRHEFLYRVSFLARCF